ncbi:MAG: hypothetical protein WCS17_01425 [Prevotella sp.]
MGVGKKDRVLVIEDKARFKTLDQLRPEPAMMEELKDKIKRGKFLEYADRVAISRVYSANGYSASKASKELGLTQAKVKFYHDQVTRKAMKEVTIEKKISEEKGLAEIENIAEASRERFMSKAIKVKMDALTRLEQVINLSTDLGRLIAVVKVLHEITNQDDPDGEQKGNSLLQIVNQQIINMNNITNNVNGTKEGAATILRYEKEPAGNEQ